MAAAGIQKGLSAIKGYEKKIEDARALAEENKVNWFKLKDGETVEVRFLQELDESGAGYLESHGLGIVALEHTNPTHKDGFKQRCACTNDEESDGCWPCEQKYSQVEINGTPGWKWKPKRRLLINVLVKRKDGEIEQAVLATSAEGRGGVIGPMVLEYAVEDGTITNRWFKIARKGSGTETEYSILPRSESSLDISKYEVSDVDKLVRVVPYEEQEKFFFPQAAKSASESMFDEPEGQKATSVTEDEEW